MPWVHSRTRSENPNYIPIGFPTRELFLLPSHASTNLFWSRERKIAEQGKKSEKFFFQCFTSIHTQKREKFLQLARKSIIPQLTWNICKVSASMEGAEQEVKAC